ncbi:MAG: LON peptidase substrate-binding domain-containing protein [Thermoanaerobaculia bacterium]
MTTRQQICPEILPVFPLTGALLLPGGRLPLHMFEPRYRNMVEDVLESAGFIGMIQPFKPAPQLDERQEPDLYEIGCAGVIERWEQTDDGRYFVILKGVARFRVSAELESVRGYRRVEADYEGFAGDLEEAPADVAADRIIEALRAFGESHQVPLDLGKLDKLDKLSGLTLLNNVAMALPFQPAEQQALLEAPDVDQRLETLLALIDMGIEMRAENPAPSLN